MGNSYGPAQRRVLESAAAELYARAVEAGALTVDRATFPPGTPVDTQQAILAAHR